MSQDKEQERLRRLREEQLSARDPSQKAQSTHQRLATHYQGSSRKTTLQGLIRDLPAAWLWMIIGLLIGLAIAIVIFQTVKADWAPYVAGVVIFFGLAAGRVTGAVLDWHKND